MEPRDITIETDGTEGGTAYLAVVVEDVFEQLGLTFDYVEHNEDLTRVSWSNVRLQGEGEEDFTHARVL
jgi:hypothetical protein